MPRDQYTKREMIYDYETLLVIQPVLSVSHVVPVGHVHFGAANNDVTHVPFVLVHEVAHVAVAGCVIMFKPDNTPINNELPPYDAITELY